MASFFKHFANSITGSYTGAGPGNGIAENTNPLTAAYGLSNALIYTCPPNRYALAYITSWSILVYDDTEPKPQIGLINTTNPSLFTRIRPNSQSNNAASTGGSTTPILVLPGEQVYVASAARVSAPSCTYEILEFYSGTL